MNTATTHTDSYPTTNTAETALETKPFIYRGISFTKEIIPALSKNRGIAGYTFFSSELKRGININLTRCGSYRISDGWHPGEWRTRGYIPIMRLEDGLDHLIDIASPEKGLTIKAHTEIPEHAKTATPHRVKGHSRDYEWRKSEYITLNGFTYRHTFTRHKTGATCEHEVWLFREPMSLGDKGVNFESLYTPDGNFVCYAVREGYHPGNGGWKIGTDMYFDSVEELISATLPS